MGIGIIPDRLGIIPITNRKRIVLERSEKQFDIMRTKHQYQLGANANEGCYE